jgi:hypothetical protein
MKAPRRDHHHRAGQPEYLRRRRDRRDRSGAQAELSMGVATPAMHFAVRGDGAGVSRACSEVANAADQAVDGDWGEGLGRSATAHLVLIIHTPAPHLARRQQGTGVRSAHGDLRHANRQRGNRDGLERRCVSADP